MTAGDDAKAPPAASDAKPSAPKGALAQAGWGLGVYAVAKLVAALLSSASMAAIVAQAVIADWGLGRIGVVWSDPDAPAPTNGTIARRALVGCAIGLGLAALVLALLAVTRGALVSRGDAPVTLAAIGLLSSGFAAMRDELFLRGLVLRVLDPVPARAPKLVACAVVGAAAAASEPGANPRTVAASALLGIVFGALWLRDRGAWLAWGAHAALFFATGTLARGVLLDARVAQNAWGGGDGGILGGAAAVVALAPVAVAALVWAARPRAAA